VDQVITIAKEAAYRQREAIRLLVEENEQLQKQAAARSRLSREAAGRAVEALAAAGVIKKADKTVVAANLEQSPEAAVEILEKMAAERTAPPAYGSADLRAKAAAVEETSDERWERTFGHSLSV
jgi:DNA-binding Lrp family transcriptional regulator